MSAYIKGIDRNQMSLGFASLDDMIDGDNKVRAIDAIVDSMDMTKHEFVYSTPLDTGRPPHDPVKMFKLYIYSYYEKIRSSRSIEKECTRNVEVMWLMEQIVPDHKCIAEFRRRNKNAIKTAFGEFTGICDELGLLGKSLAAIDGSKFRASNARKKNITVGKAKKKLEYFQKKLDEYMGSLDENDEKVLNTKGKIEELETMIGTMKEQDINEISMTDPDSRLMSTANAGYEVSYNVQNSVDSKHDLIVVTDVVTTPADQGQLYPMAAKTAEVFGTTKENPLTALADKGYFNGEDIRSCEEDELINAIVARPDEKGNEGYQKSRFTYDEGNDQYTCPQGQILYRVGKKKQEYKNRRACINCECREQCTKREQGRIIIRTEYEEVIEASVARFQENKELYRRRQMIVEHPFGTVKRTLGFTYFLTRGLENVKTENYLHMLTYNIKRVLNIYSTPDLIRRLAAIRVKRQGESLRFYVISTFLPEILLKFTRFTANTQILAT